MSYLHGKNYAVTDTVSLHGILIRLESAGLANAKHEFSRYFLMFPDLFEPFKRAFKEMMSDTSCTFEEKAGFLTGYPGLSESEARKRLEKIWTLAAGTEWRSDASQ